MELNLPLFQFWCAIMFSNTVEGHPFAATFSKRHIMQT